MNPMNRSNVLWDDVSVDDELPPLAFELTPTTLALAVTTTRDLYPIHHDREFARRQGAADPFVMTSWYLGFVGRYMSEWAGYESFLRRLEVKMNAHGVAGLTMTAYGVVTGKSVDEKGRKLVDVEVRIDNGSRPDATTATLSLELPD